MVATENPDRIQVVFDDDNLVADAGLLLTDTLSRRLGIRELADAHVDLGDAPGAANPGVKLLNLLSNALAGGDSISDAERLRAGGAARLLDWPVRAPSTLGIHLRSFTWGHVRQLDAAGRELLARGWANGAGPLAARRAGAGPDATPLTIDVDSTFCETHGAAKEGARCRNYQGRHGLHPLLATLAGTGEVVFARLREGCANSGRGGGGFLRETVSRLRAAGAAGELTVRADSGFYTHDFVRACRESDVRFSVTIRWQPNFTARVERIPEEDWEPLPHWRDNGGGEVAEFGHVSFRKAGASEEARVIVRRERVREKRKPGQPRQLALIERYQYHAFVTDREGRAADLVADHRRHAVVENVIRDLKYDLGLNHFPSGRFGANAAWLWVQVTAHNLARWTARLAVGDPTLSAGTLRRRYLSLPGRLTRSARVTTLHLPSDWRWALRWLTALERLRALPAPT